MLCVLMIQWVWQKVVAARDAARASQCRNNLRQHSGSHGLECQVCLPVVLEGISERKGPGIVPDSLRAELYYGSLNGASLDSELVKEALEIISVEADDAATRDQAKAMFWVLSPGT